MQDIAKKLGDFELATRGALPELLLKLEEVGDAIALQDLVIDTLARDQRVPMALKLLVKFGTDLRAVERHVEASRHFNRCIELARANTLPGELAPCLYRLGSEERSLGAYAEAQRHFEEALALQEEGKKPERVATLRALGVLFENSLNDYGKALDHYGRALAVARETHQPQELVGLMLAVTRVLRARGDYEAALTTAQEAEQLVATASDKDKADVALEIAKIYWYRGNYRRANERQRQGLELSRRARDSFREIQALSLAGLIALNQGELGRAEESINAALTLSRSTGRKEEEAKQLNNLGTVLRQAGRLDEAIAAFRAALAIDEKLGSTEGRAYDLRNLAVALHRKGDVSEAQRAVLEALELSRVIGEQYNQLQALFAAGEILDTMKDLQSRERYEEAAELARKTAVPEVEWRSLYALGRLARRQGDVDRARRLFAQAIEVAERLGRGRPESSEELSRDDLYADGITLEVEGGRAESAFAYIERARSRALLDLLSSRTVELPTEKAKAALALELKTREGLLAAQRDATLAVAGAADRLAAAERQHQAAVDALRKDFPRLARTFTIEPVTLAALQAALPEGVVAISYYLGRERSIALVMRRQEVQARLLPAPRADIEAVVTRIRRGMRAFAPVDEPLAALAQQILEPLADLLRGSDTLVFLPHDALYHVPFAALPLAGRPLIEQGVTSVSPSASVLADQLGRPPSPRPKRVAVLAPAEDLPFARLEAAAVAGGDALLGDSASEAALRATRADAVDIAAHGRLDARDPLATVLELAAVGTDDGQLELHEVFALTDLPPLVTLSACDAAAAEAHGAEWLGLGGAFLTAGARTVVASQSRVSDLAAAVMMKRFYRAARATSTGTALRSAALTVRRYFPHPAHWAGFALIGDFR
jgi:CHAT domain-containing protein/Tfp pilus assembly protein PilF